MWDYVKGDLPRPKTVEKVLYATNLYSNRFRQVHAENDLRGYSLAADHLRLMPKSKFVPQRFSLMANKTRLLSDKYRSPFRSSDE